MVHQISHLMHIFDLPDNERTKITTYMVVIFSESLFDGMGPVSWFKLRSLNHEPETG